MYLRILHKYGRSRRQEYCSPQEQRNSGYNSSQLQDNLHHVWNMSIDLMLHGFASKTQIENITDENYVTFKCVCLFLSPDQISSCPWPGTFVDRRGTSLIGLVDSSESVSCITTLCNGFNNGSILISLHLWITTPRPVVRRTQIARGVRNKVKHNEANKPTHCH